MKITFTLNTDRDLTDKELENLIAALIAQAEDLETKWNYDFISMRGENEKEI